MNRGIKRDLLNYYGYSIQYRVPGVRSWKSRDVEARGGTDDYTYRIDGVQYNTVYEVRVSPYRQIGDRRETGNATQILKVKTACRGNIKSMLGWSCFNTEALHSVQLTLTLHRVAREEQNKKTDFSLKKLQDTIIKYYSGTWELGTPKGL